MISSRRFDIHDEAFLAGKYFRLIKSSHDVFSPSYLFFFRDETQKKKGWRKSF